MEKADYLYHFWFVPSQMAGSECPEFVFTLHPEFHQIFTETLAKTGEFSKPIEEYFGQKKKLISVEGGPFVFDSCGYEKRVGGAHEFHLKISRKQVGEVALTIWAVLFSLRRLEGIFRPTREFPEQDVSLETVCSQSHAGHGHSIFGKVHRPFGSWLQSHGGIAIESSADAMKQVWNAVSSGHVRKYVYDCSASLQPEGRFIFRCFGNACDLSIYPDQVYKDSLGKNGARFSCHNLDSAEQQLTLLAGLAELLTVVRASRF